ncbi:MAG: hypothetical protein CR991_00670 [Proteobacteria bacterium]|nr:MAG: hypothetical protein CR991_00670 [Pseudomonadota bacterium]
MKSFKPLLLASLLCSGWTAATAEEGIAVEEELAGNVKIETITTQDRFGTIEEKRVQAMYSEIRYIPGSGSGGYNLIGSDTSGQIRNAHSDSDEMLIPSWQLFSW